MPQKPSNAIMAWLNKGQGMLALNADQLLSEIDSLPLDLKTKLVEKLLNSLNPSEKSIEELWKKEIEARVADIESGKEELVDGKEVFLKIQERLAR